MDRRAYESSPLLNGRFFDDLISLQPLTRVTDTPDSARLRFRVRDGVELGGGLSSSDGSPIVGAVLVYVDDGIATVTVAFPEPGEFWLTLVTRPKGTDEVHGVGSLGFRATAASNLGIRYSSGPFEFGTDFGEDEPEEDLEAPPTGEDLLDDGVFIDR